MSAFPDMARIVPGRVRRYILRRSFKTYPRPDLLRLGSGYGGWTIPAGVLDSNSVCYCVGVGEDATFDFALIERFGCTVHAFDPTPEAHAYIAGVGALPEEFVYHQYGVWSEDTMLRFYVPRNPEVDISHSALNLQKTDRYFEAPVRCVRSIMDELGHDSIDLLKLDIEGAEHAVLDHLVREGIKPRTLCVEFDQPCSLGNITSQIRMLEHNGYQVATTERWNFTFLKVR